jgi:hypothetical protein
VKDPHIALLLCLPEFPRIPHHTEALINISRSRRQESHFQKAAAEHITYQCRAELEVLLTDAPNEQELHFQARRDLQQCQQALDQATEGATASDHDFSKIRSLLHQRNLPTHCAFEPNLPHFSQSPINSHDDDDDDDGSCWGV